MHTGRLRLPIPQDAQSQPDHPIPHSHERSNTASAPAYPHIPVSRDYSGRTAWSFRASVRPESTWDESPPAKPGGFAVPYVAF